METTNRQKLNVMSFNIRYGTAEDGPDRWEYRKQGITQTLLKQAPDILCLQEALAFQIEEILSHLPGYRYCGVGRDDGLELGEHAAIVYNASRLEGLESGTFWLSENPSQPASNDWGDSNVRICTWSVFQEARSGKRFAVFNTHLAVASQLARDNGVNLILKRAAPIQHPVIVAGDFNADEDNPCVERMRRGGFRDSYREIYSLGPAPTYNGFQTSYPDEKIDYIWVGEKFRVLEVGIVHDRINGRWISDHFPITATLEF